MLIYPVTFIQNYLMCSPYIFLFQLAFSVREVHSDDENAVGGGHQGGASGVGSEDADWANFDSFRKSEKPIQVRAEPKPKVNSIFEPT